MSEKGRTVIDVEGEFYDLDEILATAVSRGWDDHTIEPPSPHDHLHEDGVRAVQAIAPLIRYIRALEAKLDERDAEDGCARCKGAVYIDFGDDIWHAPETE